jgi:hypothetical protein
MLLVPPEGQCLGDLLPPSPIRSVGMVKVARRTVKLPRLPERES